MHALATNLYHQGEVIESEGVYRNALSQPWNSYPASVEMFYIVTDYSLMLKEMTWNKKSRAHEGQILLDNFIEKQKRLFPKGQWRKNIPSWMLEKYR